MRIVSPVISDAAREARNTTRPATSIGSPIRMQCSNAFYYVRAELGIGQTTPVPGVRINVGATVLTVMLYFPHSTARHVVSDGNEPLDDLRAFETRTTV
jgi:hypothetical protein